MLQWFSATTAALVGIVSSHANHAHGHHSDHGHHDECPFGYQAAPDSDPARSALAATAVVTLGGNAVILLFLTVQTTPFMLEVMTLFAAGGLLGDAFLHLLPHAETDDYSFVLVGMLAFFVLEQSLYKFASRGAILNLVADAAHNFTDGFALSSAFAVSPKLGWATMSAVLMHEIPHEIGDFAVLVKNGFSSRAAFLAQFVSAIGAFLGCLLGNSVLKKHNSEALLFTAGGFIYVATVDVIARSSATKSALKSALRTIAMVLGMASMVVISH